MRILSFVSIILIAFSCNIKAFAQSGNSSKIFTLIKQKKYALALKASDSVYKKIVLSQKYLAPKEKNKFQEIVRFLEQNPKWPQANLIRIQAENSIDDSTNQQIIFNYFQKNKPLTSRGYKYYAIAADSLVKKPDNLSEIIKKGWYNGNSAKKYYDKFKNHLNEQDHIKKIESHLWKKEISAARNVLPFISAKYQQSFKAQIALIQKHPNAKQVFKKVQKQYYTQGLIYRYLECHKKNMPDISEIMDLIKIAQKNKSYADRFCNLQSYLARELIEKKNYRDAYKIVSSVFTTNVGLKSDAEFLSGWLALRYLNKPKLALQHFNSFNKIVKTPISKSRGLYWLARSYEANANIAEAKKLFALASSQYQYTFYGQMSAIEIDKKTISLPPSVNLEKYNESSTSYLKSSDIAQATLLMSKHGSTCLADAYIKSMINNALDRDERINILAFLNNNLNSTHYISHAAKNAMQKNIFVQKLAYPTPYKLANAPVERPLIYGVIKQESVFDRHAISKANAKGLMQLINITACETAKQLNVRCRVSKLTSDPAYNIKLGSSHLKHLIKKYEGSYILAIAAYNAGVHNVDKWLKTYGDPRKMTNIRNILDWLELIPFYETRNYVQRVLENVQVYRTIIEKNNTFNLKKDLLNIDLSNN